MDEGTYYEGTVARWEQPPSPPGRRVDASSWLMLLAGLPQALCSLVLMSAVGAAISPWAAWIVPMIWVALGAAVFLPSVEELLARVVHRARRPSQVEWARLYPQWLIVAQAAHLDPTRYSLWVEDSHECNASAAGGRTLIVTRQALALPDPQLAAILAHEAGHHLSSHPVAALLTLWYELPARVAVTVTRWAIAVVMWLGRVFVYLSNGVSILIASTVALFLLLMLLAVNPWLLIAPLIAIGDAAARRRGEFAADLAAVRLGFGPNLLLVLRSFMADDGWSARGGLRSRLLASHPPLPTRVARLESLLWTPR